MIKEVGRQLPLQNTQTFCFLVEQQEGIPVAWQSHNFPITVEKPKKRFNSHRKRR